MCHLTDYFKEEAIVMAWEFLTKTLNLPTNRLMFTYLEGDEETAALWQKVITIITEHWG